MTKEQKLDQMSALGALLLGVTFLIQILHLDHMQKLKCNHMQNFMFSHVATQTETET